MAGSPPPSSPWSDRRGQFQRGKEHHTPGSPMEVFARRTSTASNSDMSKVLSNESVGSNKSGGAGSPTAERRPSGTTGMFGNLMTHKRGSQDYSQRRASIEEMESKPPGWFNTTFNSTFRGIQKAPAEQQQEQMKKVEEMKRGVME